MHKHTRVCSAPPASVGAQGAGRTSAYGARTRENPALPPNGGHPVGAEGGRFNQQVERWAARAAALPELGHGRGARTVSILLGGQGVVPVAALRVAASRRTKRKSRSTRASPSITALRERGRLARAAQRASAPLAAGQAARHPGLMWYRNNVGVLAACLCFREVQGRCAVHPTRARRAPQASCESRLFCAYTSLDHADARCYEDLAPARVCMSRRADDIKTSLARDGVPADSFFLKKLGCCYTHFLALCTKRPASLRPRVFTS